MNRATHAVGDELSGKLALHLHERAREYFSDCERETVGVRLVRRLRRHNSTIYQFELSARTGGHPVIVKLPVGRLHRRWECEHDWSPPYEGPRLFSRPDPRAKAWLEYTALSRIHAHFEKLHDSRFGTVRPLDYLPEQRAVVMEEVREPSLASLFWKLNRLRQTFSSVRVGTAFRNAGAWLRAYHQVTGVEHIQSRHAVRADFIESLHEFTDFLGGKQGDAHFFQTIRDKLEKAARATLPESLPLGTGHADFALHNVFVGPADRITVIDTLARWRGPIYEDIASFLVAANACRAQIYSGGLAFSAIVMNACEREFLRGYFEQEEIPRAAIRLFESLLLLERWAAWVHSATQSTGVQRLAKQFRMTMRGRFVERYLNRLLMEISAR